MPKAKKKAPKGKSAEEQARDAEMYAAAARIASKKEEEAAKAAEEKRAADAAEAKKLLEKYADFGLSESDIMEYKEMFNLVDSDGGGDIGRDEVIELMQMVGYECTEQEVDDMIAEIDLDGNGDVDFDGAQAAPFPGRPRVRCLLRAQLCSSGACGRGAEFVTMMSRKPDALREPAEVLKAFKLFEIPALDKEKAGYVRQSSLIHALSNLSGEKLSRSEATELLSQMPAPDEKGFINYADYISMMAQ